jgi:hypothetical protein
MPQTAGLSIPAAASPMPFTGNICTAPHLRAHRGLNRRDSRENPDMTNAQHYWDSKFREGLPSLTKPDPFFVRAYENFASCAVPGLGEALDLASGLERHALWLARRDWRVTAGHIRSGAAGTPTICRRIQSCHTHGSRRCRPSPHSKTGIVSGSRCERDAGKVSETWDSIAATPMVAESA